MGMHPTQTISIHALREEGDGCPPLRWPDPCIFLSTPSARRATRAWSWADRGARNFYPRPPRGGRHCPACQLSGNKSISIHALREEGDRHFLAVDRVGVRISIHALREEGDATTPAPPAPLPYFYPRPPRGGRQEITKVSYTSDIFLSTPSARRATRTAAALAATRRFLSTPSARRATRPGSSRLSRRQYFYPRPPRGGRPSYQCSNLLP